MRALLEEPDIFSAQIRAILRARAHGDIRLLFPMVSSVEELIEAKALVEREREKLGVTPVPIGCMIEVPAVAVMLDVFAPECDFFSIGTNDLMQYALALERGSRAMAAAGHAKLVPLFRFLKVIADGARECSRPVCLCGEIASDPRFTPLLIGLGLRELSVSLRYIPAISQAIRATSLGEAKALTRLVLALSDGEKIHALLNARYRESNPEAFAIHFSK